jgi:DNA invertase Pin-like site-specific DNA recombinase
MVGYCRVSTDEQAASGHGLAAQRAAIDAEATRRGWTISWVSDHGYSGKNLRRPGIARALGLLRAPRRSRTAGGLVVAKLDRLTRSLSDFAHLMDRAHREGWALVALDLNVDTTTPAGELLANVMATVNQFERRVIAQRTRDALAVLKQRGVRLGSPRLRAGRTSERVRRRILRLCARGMSYPKIAALLNRQDVRYSLLRQAAAWNFSATNVVRVVSIP